MHKAQPLDPVNPRPFRIDDIKEAALAFPDLTIEIVHGGCAFLEETALQYRVFKNIVVNLEGTTLLLTRQKRKFLEILGTLLYKGGADRIVWATGSMLFHPQPPLELFWALEMPDDLIDGYGVPELTDEMKRGILGGNQARIPGLDTSELALGIAGDTFARSVDRLEAPSSHGYRPPLDPVAAA